MHVLAWGRAASLERATADGYEAEPDLDALCERSDVVSVHLKLTPETRGLVTARHLSLMKPDALFVNTARAGLVEQGALAAALAAGRPGSAAVDVFDEEPASADDPLVCERRRARDAAPRVRHLGHVRDVLQRRRSPRWSRSPQARRSTLRIPRRLRRVRRRSLREGRPRRR